jgi:hypothetical protein
LFGREKSEERREKREEVGVGAHDDPRTKNKCILYGCYLRFDNGKVFIL